jgi:methyl-accepting chemotaxis protein
MSVNLQTDTAGTGTTADKIVEGLSTATHRSGERASGAIEQLKERTRDIAQRQKEAGAKQVSTLARAVHEAAEELGHDFPRLARYVDDAAERLDRAASALRERSVDDLVRGVGDFARRQPATFFGAAVLAGFALSRFLKSAARNTG